LSESEGSRARTLDAVRTVRSHPEWFFRTAEFDTTELISLLVEEATRAGARHVEVRHEDEWFGVTADTDWLAGDLAAFFAPLSYPEGGRNSSRVEVALTAFCDGVVTGANGGVLHEVKSSRESPHHDLRFPWETPTEGRLVAFLPPVESRTSHAEQPHPEPTHRVGLRLVQGEGEDKIISAIQSLVRKLEDA
jgi:hypothetical protein